jgi:hypothetical protein
MSELSPLSGPESNQGLFALLLGPEYGDSTSSATSVNSSVSIVTLPLSEWSLCTSSSGMFPCRFPALSLSFPVNTRKVFLLCNCQERAGPCDVLCGFQTLSVSSLHSIVGDTAWGLGNVIDSRTMLQVKGRGFGSR